MISKKFGFLKIIVLILIFYKIHYIKCTTIIREQSSKIENNEIQPRFFKVIDGPTIFGTLFNTSNGILSQIADKTRSFFTRATNTAANIFNATVKALNGLRQEKQNAIATIINSSSNIYTIKKRLIIGAFLNKSTAISTALNNIGMLIRNRTMGVFNLNQTGMMLLDLFNTTLSFKRRIINATRELISNKLNAKINKTNIAFIAFTDFLNSTSFILQNYTSLFQKNQSFLPFSNFLNNFSNISKESLIQLFNDSSPFLTELFNGKINISDLKNNLSSTLSQINSNKFEILVNATQDIANAILNSSSRSLPFTNFDLDSNSDSDTNFNLNNNYVYEDERVFNEEN